MSKSSALTYTAKWLKATPQHSVVVDFDFGDHTATLMHKDGFPVLMASGNTEEEARQNLDAQISKWFPKQ